MKRILIIYFILSILVNSYALNKVIIFDDKFNKQYKTYKYKYLYHKKNNTNILDRFYNYLFQRKDKFNRDHEEMLETIISCA